METRPSPLWATPATALVLAPARLVTTTQYRPAWFVMTPRKLSKVVSAPSALAPATGEPLNRHE